MDDGIEEDGLKGCGSTWDVDGVGRGGKKSWNLGGRSMAFCLCLRVGLRAGNLALRVDVGRKKKLKIRLAGSVKSIWPSLHRSVASWRIVEVEMMQE